MPAPDTCGAVQPCGGDLTGTWKVLGGCLMPAGLENMSCPQDIVTITTLSFAGSVTFTNAMDYAATDFTKDLSTIETIPTSCLGGETCAQLDKAYKQVVDPSASCSGSTTCTCTAVQKGATVIGTGGTFSLQGGDLSFTMATGGTSTDSFGPYAYCVQNDLLHLLTIAITVDSTGNQTVVVYGDIVAQKQ